MRVNNKNVFDTAPDAVFFDLDGTIYDYDSAHNKAIASVEDKVQEYFSMTKREIRRGYEQARVEVKASLSGCAASHSRLLYFQKFIEKIGLGSQITVALDLEQTYWRTFMVDANLYVGVAEFLDELRLKKIRTCIVTDFTVQHQFRKLIHFDLDGVFDYVVTSEEAGFDKPNSAPFLLAKKKLSLQDSNIWMIFKKTWWARKKLYKPSPF